MTSGDVLGFRKAFIAFRLCFAFCYGFRGSCALASAATDRWSIPHLAVVTHRPTSGCGAGAARC